MSNNKSRSENLVWAGLATIKHLVLFLVLFFIFSRNVLASCPPLGWLENGYVSGDLKTPTFNWTWENNSYGGSGLYINLYLFNCSAMNDSCRIALGSGGSTPVTSMPFSALGIAPLECNKTYWWTVYAGDACTGSMQKDGQYWTFTTPPCLPPPPPPPQYHFECQNEACVKVDGGGQNTCTSDSQCIKPRHYECRNEACTRVEGYGVDQCTSDSQCKTPTHKECRNNACALVNGGGVDRCSWDSDCQSRQEVTCDWLSVSPNSGYTTLNVTAQLSGHTSNGGYISSYKFNFGDNSGDINQSGSSVTHSYNRVGTYTVNGYVLDNLGNISSGGNCQKIVTVSQKRRIPPPPPPYIPKTGPEFLGIVGIIGSGISGLILRRKSFSRNF